MKKTILFLLILLPALLVRLPVHAAENTRQKVAGKIITHPERPEADTPAETDTTATLPFSVQALGSGDFSLYRLWFDFTHDHDGDGYSHQFNLSIDLDTRFTSASVYVTGQLDNGSTTPLFRTDPFSLHGATGSDSYQLTVLLTEGYPSTRYALTLRVYDAQTHSLLLTLDARDDSALASLDLEDIGRDTTQTPALHLFQIEYTLSGDHDSDGFFTAADVRFDADAPGETRWMYARLYLIDDDGHWLWLRTTASFSVSGYSSADRLYTGFELEQGFDPQRYRLGLELYDAWSNALLLTSVTPDSAPLHMESHEYDSVADDYDDGHSGGALPGLTLIALLALWRRRRR